VATLRPPDPEDRHVLPPGPRGLPLLGNVLQFRRDQLGFLLQLQRTYGSMATMFIGRTPVVLLFRPEHVRYILTENPGNFTNREVAGGLIFGHLLILSLLARSFSDKAVKGLQDLVGDGLLMTDGDVHDLHRRLLQPAFTKRRVESHTGLIVHYTREAMERWGAESPIDLAHDMQDLILRITAGILLDFDVQGTEAGRIMESILKQPIGLFEALLDLQFNLPFTPYGRRKALMREADSFIYTVIDRRRAERRNAGDVLSILLQTEDGSDADSLTSTQIRDELVTLLAAGYETTSNTMVWTFYLLARYPAVMQKVVSELQTVLAGRDPDEADLVHLTYLDWTVKESMRLYPSAWTQGRRAVRAFDLDGYRFPAGTIFMFSQWVLHRLPDIWGDPERFRPERWDRAGGQTVSRWAYIPYGVGPRRCLGMSLAQLETRLVLATILQRFIPELVPGRPVTPLPLVTLRAEHGLWVRLRRAVARST